MKKIILTLALSGFFTLSLATISNSTITTNINSNSTTKIASSSSIKQKIKKKIKQLKHKYKKKHKPVNQARSLTGPRANQTSPRPITLPATDTLPSKTISSTPVPKTTINHTSIEHQPKLYSSSALVMDVKTGQILVSKNPNAQLPIASISKLMMAMILLDSNADLDQYVTISQQDVDNIKHTYSRLQVGTQLRRRDLLLLALMSSENRAAHALGRTAYPGGIKPFISKMNEKARSLGMNNTHFYEPTGLNDENKSTALDVSKMVQAAFAYNIIREDTTTKGADVELRQNYIHHYMNSDALVRNSNLQIELSKTGFINEAGHCLAIYSIVNSRPVIMVFLNSTSKNGRLLDAIAVRNYLDK